MLKEEALEIKRGGKKSKTRLTIAIFVNAAGQKINESIVTWRSAKPRCFKNLINLKRPYDMHYYSSNDKRNYGFYVD